MGIASIFVQAKLRFESHFQKLSRRYSKSQCLNNTFKVLLEEIPWHCTWISLRLAPTLRSPLCQQLSTIFSQQLDSPPKHDDIQKDVADSVLPICRMSHRIWQGCKQTHPQNTLQCINLLSAYKNTFVLFQVYYTSFNSIGWPAYTKTG